MGAWGPSIFSDDMALDVRSEYSVLLSVGKSNEEVEEMLIDYYSSIMNCNDPDEEVFWFTLALCEWKKGRLSPFVKEKALSALEAGRDLERWNSPDNQKNYKERKKVLEDLRNVILSPMPPAKKVRKPTVHHCPWKVGSLLAYRIVSNKRYLSGHPCFMKYVLLRVIKIEKHPVSTLFETEYYDESMLVGLYNWIGDSIPNPEIVNQLEYIPIEDYVPQQPTNPVDLSLLNGLPAESRKKVEEAVMSLFERKIVTCVDFDWLPSGNIEGDITCIDCDESYQHSIPDFFNTSMCGRVLTHYLPFDITLAQRMECYLDKD